MAEGNTCCGGTASRSAAPRRQRTRERTDVLDRVLGGPSPLGIRDLEPHREYEGFRSR